MVKPHNICMLGSGLIGMFYTMTLHSHRKQDRVRVICSLDENVRDFARKWDIPRWTKDIREAINDPEVDVVVVGLPNDLHREAVSEAAKAGKSVQKPKTPEASTSRLPVPRPPRATPQQGGWLP